MFRQYLTYQFALSFHQLCLIYDARRNENKQLILQYSEGGIQAFTKYMYAKTVAEEKALLEETLRNFVSAHGAIEENAPMEGEMLTKYQIVTDRLGQIIAKYE